MKDASRFTYEGQEWHAPTVAAQNENDFVENAHEDYYISLEPKRKEILHRVHQTAVKHVADMQAKAAEKTELPAVEPVKAVAEDAPTAQAAPAGSKGKAAGDNAGGK